MTNYTEKEIEERAWREENEYGKERFREIAVSRFLQENESLAVQLLLAKGQRKKMIQNIAFDGISLEKAAKDYAEKNAPGICKDRWMQKNNAFRLEGVIWAPPPSKETETAK